MNISALSLSPLLIAALVLGICLGLALICFSFFAARRLSRGMTAAFAAVGILACVSAGLMLAGLLLQR